MVLGEVAEGDGVADVCCDLWGIEGELGCGADGDRVIGGKGKGNEGEKCGCGGGIHCDKKMRKISKKEI